MPKNHAAADTLDPPVAPAPEDHMAHGHETGRGYLNGPGLVNFPVEYSVVKGDICIHDGCIELGTRAEVEAEAARIDAELRALNATGSGDAVAADVQKGVGLPSDSAFLWTNGILYYTVNASVPDPDRIDDAIAHIHENTGIRIVQRTSQANYVEIISNGNEGWSSSAVGMRGGKQLLRYSDRHGWQILVHELMHALGVYHEQSRSDRDSFVEIKWDNIQDDAVGNFQTKPGTTDYFSYDYGSIMHYPRSSFAKDPSKPTIVPKQPGVTIGQRERMSFTDRQTVAKMYQRFFPSGYAGVWRAGTGGYGLWVNATWQSFVAKWQEWSAQGLRLHDIHVRVVGGEALYSGIFLPGNGRYGLWANVPWSSFRAKWQEWSESGLRLIDMNICRVGTEDRYSGVFLEGSGGYGLWVNTDWNSFRDRWQQWSAQGLRLVDVNVQQVGNDTRYSGIFLNGTGGHALWANVSWPSFVAKWSELSQQGLRLVDLNMHKSGSELRYSGCFLPGADAHYLWANVSWESFRAKWQELAAQGLRLIDFEIAIPSSGVAAVADQSLIGDTDDAGDLEPFGGIFEGPPALRDAGLPLSAAEHGGLGGVSRAPDGITEAAEDHGGANFGDQEVPGEGGAAQVIASAGGYANGSVGSKLDTTH